MQRAYCTVFALIISISFVFAGKFSGLKTIWFTHFLGMQIIIIIDKRFQTIYHQIIGRLTMTHYQKCYQKRCATKAMTRFKKLFFKHLKTSSKWFLNTLGTCWIQNLRTDSSKTKCRFQTRGLLIRNLISYFTIMPLEGLLDIIKTVLSLNGPQIRYFILSAFEFISWKNFNWMP